MNFTNKKPPYGELKISIERFSDGKEETSRFFSDIELRLQQILDKAANDMGPEVMIDAARHLCLAKGAKRARPWTVFLFGQAIEAPYSAIIDIAVAAELIHAASLLHDDIVDEGKMRRGRPTVNAKWGNIVAVLTGDLVLSAAFAQLKELPIEITRNAIELVGSMSRAAMREALARGNIHLTIDQWRLIATGKTGELFGWCGESIARIAENTEAVKKFQICARHLGIAFQMADDLKDIIGTGTGKNRFSDILMHNPNFPILTAVKLSKNLLEKMEKAWNKRELNYQEAAELGNQIAETKAIEITTQQVEKEIAIAMEALGPYKEKCGGRDIVLWAHLLRQSIVPNDKKIVGN